MAGNPARIWLTILGFTLVAVAILGLVGPAVDLLHRMAFHIEAGEDWLHWGLAALTLGLAFGVRDDGLLATLAMAYGAVYVLVGILGFFVDTIGPWHVGLADNVLHLALGAVTIGAGALSRSGARPSAAPPPG